MKKAVMLLAVMTVLVVAPNRIVRAAASCDICECWIRVGADPTEVSLCDANPGNCSPTASGENEDEARRSCDAGCQDLVHQAQAERPDITFSRSFPDQCHGAATPEEDLAPVGQSCQCTCSYANGDETPLADRLPGRSECAASCRELAPQNADGSAVALVSSECIFVPAPASGASEPSGGDTKKTFVPATYNQGGIAEDLSKESGSPLGAASPQQLIGLAVRTLVGLSGSIALLVVVYGGFIWITSAGDSNRIKKGKDILIWAALGLAIIFAAYALVSFVLTRLVGLT